MSRRRAPASDLPLLRWGDEMRIAQALRRRRHRALATVAIAAGALVATTVWRPAARLIWNASASVPIGLYAVDRLDRPQRGDLVVARLVEPYRTFAADRGYIPAGVPLLKRIAAVPGDEVCALGRDVVIDGKPVAVRRSLDGRGRAMPAWSGCHVLAASELFLLVSDEPGSFDGRYFGVTQRVNVLGRAVPLWLR